VLSTADKGGRVSAAIYGRPHFMDDQTIVFIAADRLTHANLQSNKSAAYLFKEDGSYQGKRLYLTMTHEEKNSPLIENSAAGSPGRLTTTIRPNPGFSFIST